MFLLLCGPPGVGKSVAVASRCEKVMPSAEFRVVAGELMISARVVFARTVECARFSLFDREDVAKVGAMRTADLLVIDDLDQESYHDTWRATLEDVIDARYQARAATVLTTNLDPDAFKKRYGARIADRIRHGGLVVRCGSESLRRPSKRLHDVATFAEASTCQPSPIGSADRPLGAQAKESNGP